MSNQDLQSEEAGERYECSLNVANRYAEAENRDGMMPSGLRRGGSSLLVPVNAGECPPVRSPFHPGEDAPAEMGPGTYWHVPAGSVHKTGCVSEEPCLFYTHGDEKWDIQVLEE